MVAVKAVFVKNLAFAFQNSFLWLLFHSYPPALLGAEQVEQEILRINPGSFQIAHAALDVGDMYYLNFDWRVYF